MINNDEMDSYENIERAIVKRLTDNKRYKQRKQNVDEVLKLSSLIVERLTTEYIKFLIRFYTKRNEENARNILSRFLKTLDLKFNSLSLSSVYRNYRKLIHNQIKDYDINEDEDDRSFFENCAVNSHLLYSGRHKFHYIN